MTSYKIENNKETFKEKHLKNGAKIIEKKVNNEFKEFIRKLRNRVR